MNVTWLHIVPDGMNSAASLPSNGDPLLQTVDRRILELLLSSPTSAEAIAWRIAAVGRVIVSLKRSMRIMGGPWTLGGRAAKTQRTRRDISHCALYDDLLEPQRARKLAVRNPNPSFAAIRGSSRL